MTWYSEKIMISYVHKYVVSCPTRTENLEWYLIKRMYVYVKQTEKKSYQSLKKDVLRLHLFPWKSFCSLSSACPFHVSPTENNEKKTRQITMISSVTELKQCRPKQNLH